MATINITGVGAPLNFALGAVVNVSALPSGATTYLWEFIDKPDGSTAAFDDDTAQNTFFTADVEGTYLIRLTVDGVDVAQNAAAVPFLTSIGPVRIPAAGETGWSRALQGALKTAIEALNIVNSIVSFSWKAPVRVSSNVDVPLAGSTPLSIDGVTLADGDRVLLRAQLAPENNGIYVFNDGGGTYTLTRPIDADEADELAGATVLVQEGSLFADRTYMQRYWVDVGVARIGQQHRRLL